MLKIMHKLPMIQEHKSFYILPNGFSLKFASKLPISFRGNWERETFCSHLFHFNGSALQFSSFLTFYIDMSSNTPNTCSSHGTKNRYRSVDTTEINRAASDLGRFMWKRNLADTSYKEYWFLVVP